MVAKGKNKNVAIVAIARELAGFIWDIGRLGMEQAIKTSRPAV
jgi:transposase